MKETIKNHNKRPKYNKMLFTLSLLSAASVSSLNSTAVTFTDIATDPAVGIEYQQR